MHANRIFFLSIIFIGFVVSIQAQNNCPCLHENSGARWISNTPAAESCTRSSGNSKNIVQRICQLTTGDLVNCTVQLNCTGFSSTPNWTPWSSVGPCNASCGLGKQMQTRICHKNLEGNPETKIRSTMCTGSNDQNEQTRLQNCTRFQPNCTQTTSPTSRNINQRQATTIHTLISRSLAVRTSTTSTTSKSTILSTTTTTPTPTTTTVATTTTPTTTTAATITHHSTISTPLSKTRFPSLLEDDTARNFIPNPTPSNEKSPQSNHSSLVTRIVAGHINKVFTTTTPAFVLVNNNSSLTLALVLCAVAVICVAVIISFVIVFKRRPIDDRHSDGLSDSINKEKKQSAHNYEDVGPALPPQRKMSPKSNNKNNEIPFSVRNILYAANGDLTEDAKKPSLTSLEKNPLHHSTTKTELNMSRGNEKSSNKEFKGNENKPTNKKLRTRSDHKETIKIRKESEKSKKSCSKKIKQNRYSGTPSKRDQSKIGLTNKQDTIDDYVKVSELPLLNMKIGNSQKDKLLVVSPSNVVKTGDIGFLNGIENTNQTQQNSKNKNDFSDLNYVSIEQLKSVNVL